MNILKAAGLVLVAVIVLGIAFRLVGAPINSVMKSTQGLVSQSAPAMMDGANYDARYVSHDDAYAEDAAMRAEMGIATNGSIGIPTPPPDGGSVGGDAEEFEVTEYRASFETRDREPLCAEIAGLKGRDDVVFERANEHDRGCDYTFKVEHDQAGEILAFLEELEPKDLSENTYTIQRRIENITSEEEILKRKLASIDETLETATGAYDDITELATNTQNAEALATIISSKVEIIERLTQERININAQLERLARAKARQTDKLEYTYFYVNVYENKFIDGEQLADSWKAAVRGFVRDVNKIAQDLTVNLLSFLLIVAQYVLYLLIVLFVAKYLWKASKYIWKM